MVPTPTTYPGHRTPLRALFLAAALLAAACDGSPSDAGGEASLQDLEILQRFGVWNPGWDGYHLAVDLAGAGGDPVRAVADGTVIEARTAVPGYGAVVVIEHPSGDGSILTIYGHLSTRAGLGVLRGEEVGRGEVIALLADDDEDGGPWSPHLHLGMREGPHMEGPHLCGFWMYVGYTRECVGVSHEDFLAAGWLDPEVVIGPGFGLPLEP